MAKRIIRGAFVGIFLGVCLGICLSYALRIKRLADERRNEYVAVNQRGQEVIEANTDAGAYRGRTGEECRDLMDVILRFHVKANSNSEEDLAIKYAVRDAVIYKYQSVLQGDMTRQEVMTFLEDNLDNIEELAVETIEALGYSYPVSVYISNDYFPMRQYGELVFPAGYYDALRIDIGAARGENFWCILYPMMCYPLDTGAILSREDEKELKKLLSSEEYERLFIKREPEVKNVKIKFKFLEWIN